MRTEFRIVSRVVTGHDFYEGIRAVIVDKDHSPRWQPPSLDAVSDADVAAHFAPIAGEARAVMTDPIATEQRQTLDPVHAGEEEGRADRWAPPAGSVPARHGGDLAG